ncbi:murein biosynthesis integral membrane protein MurJ [Mycobacterium sp. 1274756.6]|uniref:murein biosynthesis integral membrane protein MurJ n=1 Tax=Mycobacterium sp. 1274756.6 TaxID=1834076 RepID=UPI0007FDB969|nr:murein biosynthesis integral membrane protein MurJ [Mycobacterium sp. 1274756.6]OBJ68141.1 murein biosynthesis integral membrane protein MurJ [Mycobacterium sp. 1274756.6]
MSSPKPAPRPELSDAAVVSRSWGMALATLVSRITGFIRIVLLAAILGAALSSAFSVANQLPNLIAALVLEATFTAIFVPVLARAERDDPDGGAAFVRRLVTLATSLLLVTTVVSVAAAPLLVRLMLGGDPQVNEPLTTAFAYLLLPQVIFYGLSSVFMAILNNRNIFGPPAWAPVVNNVIAIATLVLYLLMPGELSVDPVRMGNAKLLVLGVGTTLGVVAQAAVLLVAIGRERISLRPLWGIDDRLKRFGAMAAAMVLYVLISQIGLVVGNQIASTAAASGPAIYTYTWLVLMLPFGMIGVTVLTVVMPRLSRNAAADDTPAVLDDLSLATRLTMLTLIPIVAVMTVGGPAIGSALFAYGNFGSVDAGYLGAAISLSAFTLIPYALVLLQLRVFYAREQPWTPIAIIVIITTVKIIGSLIAPHVTDNPDMVAGFLGLANGLGFLAGAVAGHILLRRRLRPPDGHLVALPVVRTVLVTIAASLLAGTLAHAVDRLAGLQRWTEHGGLGSLARLVVLTMIVLPLVALILVQARVPDALAAVDAVRRRFGRPAPAPAGAAFRPDRSARQPAFAYPEHTNSPTPGIRRVPPGERAGAGTPKGPEVTESSSTASGGATEAGGGSTADSFQPDVAAQRRTGSGDAPSFDRSARPATDPDDDQQLVPGTSVIGGRYRLLVFHGGPPGLQFWQALDTALDRQVALTFVDPENTLTDEQRETILSRTLRLSRIEHPGIARILDVAHTSVGGLVVAEWIRGGSLREVAETAPSPIGATRAVQSLAGAAEAAHRAGVALSIDHPSRVRVSIDGQVALAFPATMPDASPDSDIGGIGAVLYALLVNRWPLTESGTASGLPPAERDRSGQPLEPASVNPDIPFQISTAALHSVRQTGRIRSAATLLNLLKQAAVVADHTDLLAPVDVEPPAPAPDEDALAQRRRMVMIGAGVGVAIIAVFLLVLASVLNRMFGDVSGGLDKDRLGLNTPSAASESGAEDRPTAPAGSVVKPVSATVFSPDGGADNPGDAGLAIDGDRTTAWKTDIYTDPTPFPGFKSGVGLLLQLPEATEIGSVTIAVSSTGTEIELRSASSSSPAKLDDTTELTPAKKMKPGENTIEVDSSETTSTLLVWISKLGTTNGESRADISEITVRAAS